MTEQSPKQDTNRNDNGNQINLNQIGQLLQGLSVGNLQPQKKPQFQDVPPVWQEQFMLGQTGENDLRRYTQLKLWIKPPSQRFLTANAFMSLVNTKGSVFVRLLTIDELDALRVWLDNTIPQMRTVMEAQKPLEDQLQRARQAYELVANQVNHDDDNYES